MKIKTRTLAHVAILVTIEIVLSRFLSISTPVVKIGFAFVPVVICAMLYGPFWAGVVGGVSDVIGAILFPIGMYFPGFTISSILSGVVYGVFLHKGKCSWPKLITMVLINRICIGLFLSTYWFTVLTKLPFLVLLSSRAIQAVVLIPVQLLVIKLLDTKLRNRIEV